MDLGALHLVGCSLCPPAGVWVTWVPAVASRRADAALWVGGTSTRGSPRALQALMNVTTNVIYSAIHYWYWRDCILILSFAVKINTLHAGYKSVFAFNCKSE